MVCLNDGVRQLNNCTTARYEASVPSTAEAFLPASPTSRKMVSYISPTYNATYSMYLAKTEYNNAKGSWVLQFLRCG